MEGLKSYAEKFLGKRNSWKISYARKCTTFYGNSSKRLRQWTRAKLKEKTIIYNRAIRQKSPLEVQPRISVSYNFNVDRERVIVVRNAKVPGRWVEINKAKNEITFCDGKNSFTTNGRGYKVRINGNVTEECTFGVDLSLLQKDKSGNILKLAFSQLSLRSRRFLNNALKKIEIIAPQALPNWKESFDQEEVMLQQLSALMKTAIATKKQPETYKFGDVQFTVVPSGKEGEDQERLVEASKKLVPGQVILVETRNTIVAISQKDRLLVRVFGKPLDPSRLRCPIESYSTEADSLNAHALSSRRPEPALHRVFIKAQ